ncbi:MAG: radical SAM protein, partial [Planctomycetota bacterium]|nr:radical SAM protein [Planctomycetota bacterium]
MKTTISFCDLAHEEHSCNGIPIGVSMVASYSLVKFKGGIEAEIFKRPLDYITYLEKGIPDIVCFSNYIWNLNLSYEIARVIKEKSPGTVVVFGGPNYPLEPQNQGAFLHAHPA